MDKMQERLAILRQARRLAAPWFQRGFMFAGANTLAAEARLHLRHRVTGEEVTLRMVDGELVEQRDAPPETEPAISVLLRPHTSTEIEWTGPKVSETSPTIQGLQAADPRPARSIREAVDFLRGFLGDAERPAREVRTAAELASFHWRSIQEASTRLLVDCNV